MSDRGGEARTAALRDGWLADPLDSRRLASPVRRIVLEPDLDGSEAELLAALDLPRPWLVASDETTREVLGRRIERALRAAGLTLVRPKADLATATDLAMRTRHAATLIAVGSGTLNDLVKHAAFASARPYAVFATAPSMNGYVTATASLTVAGVKSTLPAAPPQAALFDLAVLAAAPVRLIRAGLGDSLCRTTAEVDWLLAHLLLGTGYDRRPFMLQAADEPGLLGSGGGLAGGDPEAVARLTRQLVFSGLGMALARSSAPASQGEHLISHLLDMWQPDSDRLHGEQVGVATLTMSRLQHRLIRSDAAPAVIAASEDGSLLAGLDPSLHDHARAALHAKAPTPVVTRRLEQNWEKIRARLDPAMLRTRVLERALREAGAPATPEDLGIEPALYGRAVRTARALRDRYTALDLAAASGMLEPFIREETGS